MTSSERSILVDADVVSHFVTADESLVFNTIFPKRRIVMLDKVHAELQQWPSENFRTRVAMLLSKKIIRLINFPEDNEVIVREYAWIKTMLFKGDGESACLAFVRYSKDVLASSNLKDIKSYCTMHKIDYLTTMDFLCEAFRQGVFDLPRCNRFIQPVKTAGGKLPVDSMKEYNCRAIDFL